jgi:hypothetical protein
MNDNLGGESFNRKLFRKKLSRTSVRLCGWMKYRIQRSKKPWVHIRLESFCDLTGKSLRTAKRCLNALREDNNDLVIRTINQDGVWKVVASTCGRLHGLNRSEPFSSAEDGSKQIVKESIRGKEIKEEQLIVGEDKVYWNAKSKTYDCLATDQEVGGLVEHLTCNEDVVGTNTLDSKSSADLQSASFSPGQRTENPCVPGQMKLDLDVPDSKSGATYALRMRGSRTEDLQSPGSDVLPLSKGGNSKEFKVKHQNHEQARICSKGIKKLSFFLAREMRNSHYDNIKVAWELPFCYAFAKESLIKRANKRTILKAWEIAVHEIHAEAVDQGVTEPGSWRPSSTLSRARKILEEGECFWKWKPSLN